MAKPNTKKQKSNNAGLDKKDKIVRIRLWGCQGEFTFFARSKFSFLGGIRVGGQGVAVTTVSNSLILGGWVTKVFDKKYGVEGWVTTIF